MVWSLCNWSLLQLCQLNSSLPMQLIHHANWMELMLMQLIKTDPWTYSSHGTTQTWRQGSLNWTTTRTNNTPTNMSTPELNSKCFHHRPISIGYPCVWQLKMCNRINDYSPTVPSSWGLAFLLLSLTMSTTPPIILSSVSPHPDTNLQSPSVAPTTAFNSHDACFSPTHTRPAATPMFRTCIQVFHQTINIDQLYV